MPVRLGLPSPRISTKLYGILALFLGVVYALATCAIQFAGRAEHVVSQYRSEGIGSLALSARLQVLLEQHRRMVATAPFVSVETGGENQRIYRELNATIAGVIDRIAPQRSEKLSQRFALVASQGGLAFELAHQQQREQAIAAAARYASATDGLTLELLTEARRRAAAAEGGLERLVGQARALTHWVGAAAAITGLLIGPLCLLLLRRMLVRTQGIGTALIRLARNDTSVDIPGVGDQDELGQLARSVAVFKAKSIELLGKKADVERLNLQLDAAINTMPLGLSMFDQQERLLMCNRRFTEMYDVPAELTQSGTALCALREHRVKQGARHTEPAEAVVPGATQASSMHVEFGSGRIIEVSREPLKGGGWISLHEDITERRRQEERIAHLACHDALTGLANRMLFRERLEQSLQKLVRGQGFAVLCLDLDHFKAVNDTLGHPIGDALLKHVSQRLLGCVRHGDLVARLGGDEFAIIQVNARDLAQTEVLAQRIVESVSAPYAVEGNRIDIGTSIGITMAPRDGRDVDKLMKNADLALYRAKAAGRRGFMFFRPEMQAQVQVRRNFEVELRKAFDEEALELFYQPIVCFASEQAIGLEAQVRWHAPDRGLVSADELATVAEEAGLTNEIGRWTLRRACADAVRWPENVRIAVAVARRLLLGPSFIESVLQALSQSGLAPHRLEIEVPEAALREAPKAVAVLHQLRRLGVHLALDDFGSGTGSLSALRAFPFDIIRIGRGLIADAEYDERARVIFETVVALGARLQMATVAGDIADFDQLSRMRGSGCRAGQGFLLAPPMAADEVENYLMARAASAQVGPRAPQPAAPVNPASAETAAPPASSQAA